MIFKALRRARLKHRILVIALLLFVAGLFGAVGVTSAFFNADLDTKTATFAGGYLAVPTIGGVSPATNSGSGYNGVLTFTNGLDQTTTANEIQQIFGVDRGTTNNCTSAVYSTTVTNSITSPTTASTFTYTDTGRATSPSNINGDWYCYEIVHGWPNTTTPDWTVATTTNVQIGLAPTSILINGGTTNGDNKINSNDGNRHTADTIQITYNQPVTVGGAPTLCMFNTSPQTVFIGDASCTTNGSDTFTNAIGKITGTTNGANKSKFTTSLAGNSSNVLTITVTQGGGGQTATLSSPQFVSITGGTGALASTTGSAAPCTSAASTCTLSGTSITGHF